MGYSHPQPVGKNGVRFVLDQGTPNELYKFILRALAQHYQNNGLRLDSAPTHNLNIMPFGETGLRAHHVIGERNHGYVNINYFCGGREGHKRKEVDYRASRAYSHTDDITTYDSITIFFNTCLPGIPKDAQDWARTSERDVFLDKIVSGELP